MAIRQNTFLLKRSSVAGKVPTAGTIQLGELALNTADVKLYASGTTTNSILEIGWDRVARTGDTMTGTLFTPYLSATTVSATTYLNLPLDIRVTGSSYNSSTGILTLTNNTGGTFTASGFYTNANDIFVTGGTPNNASKLYTFTNNTGGTFNVTALTDISITGFTYLNNTFTLTNNTGGTFTALINTMTGLTINGTLTVTGNTSLQALTATTITANTISATTFTGNDAGLSGKSYGEYYVVGNTSATTITGTTNFVKVVAATTAGSLRGFSTSNNRITYTGSTTITAMAFFNTAIQIATSNNNVIRSIIAKNGVTQASSEMTAKNASTTAIINSSSTGIVSLATNDYIELWVRNTTGANDIIFDSVHVTIKQI